MTDGFPNKRPVVRKVLWFNHCMDLCPNTNAEQNGIDFYQSCHGDSNSDRLMSRLTTINPALNIEDDYILYIVYTYLS